MVSIPGIFKRTVYTHKYELQEAMMKLFANKNNLNNPFKTFMKILFPFPKFIAQIIKQKILIKKTSNNVRIRNV